MKIMKIKIFILSFVVAFMFIGCDEIETEGVSGEPSAPATFELAGDNPYFMGVGNEFVEPGVTVVGGTLVSTDVNVSNTIPGAYYVEYVAINADGFTTSTRRDVIAVENYEPFTFGEFSSGMYTSNTPHSASPFQIKLQAIATGVLYIPDVLLYHYQIGSGYGPAYGAPAILNHLGGDVYEFLETPENGFGTITVENMTITATSISWNCTLDAYAYNFGGFLFNASLN